MLAMAAADLVGLVLFAGTYGVAAARLVTGGASQALLAILFVVVTALWVRVERRHAGLGFVRRLGRAAVGLVLAGLGGCVLALMPLFALDAQVPEEAGLRPVLGLVMAVLLASLVMLAVVNLVGGAVSLVLSLARRPARPAGHP